MRASLGSSLMRGLFCINFALEGGEEGGVLWKRMMVVCIV